MKPPQEIHDAAALRRHAEQRLSKQQAETPVPDADLHKLLHELQVHQIELEMQNEALEQARQQTETDLANYTELYDFAPIGYFTLDPDGVIQQLNLTGADLLGSERSHLVGRRLGLFVEPADRPTCNAWLKRVFAGSGPASCELTLAGRDDPPRSVRMETGHAPSGPGGCRTVMLDITARKQAQAIIWRQANYDLLTGLPNRHLFQDRLGRSIGKTLRSGLPLALLFIDLDRFKEVNDRFGHEAGDTLLVEAARRIATCVRQTDTTARLAGDEFTVIMPELAQLSRIDEVAQNILNTLTKPFRIGSETFHISASIGIALCPADATDIKGLLTHADQAMYRAKTAGRGRFSYFTNKMQSAALEHLALLHDLSHALAAGQLEVHFQPIVELATGRPVMTEALLRWRHPQRGLIDPARFIPLAEESGLINDIGDWMFKETLRLSQRWNESRRPGEEFIPVSVNKSSRQFLTGRAHETWIEHLRSTGLPPACLIIEIPEGLLLEKHSAVRNKLFQFHECGVRIALDNFGTGCSMIASLQRFQIAYLKIDRSFIQGMATHPQDRAIVEADIAMAHKLGIKVIAVGVETVAQRDRLIAADCDYAQGYMLGKPAPHQEPSLA